MDIKLSKGLATACSLAALLALGACGDRATESAADQSVRNEMAARQAESPAANEEAAARAAAQRSGSAELAQGSGT